jgi:hypothetical protein
MLWCLEFPMSRSSVWPKTKEGVWTEAGYLLQTRRTLDRIQDRDSKPKIQIPSLGSRLALYGGPYRPDGTLV